MAEANKSRRKSKRKSRQKDPSKRLGYRIAWVLESPLLFVTMWLSISAFPLYLVTLLSGTNLPVEGFWIIAAIPASFGAFFHFVFTNNLRFEPGYALYLAQKAGKPPGEEADFREQSRANLRLPFELSKWHFRAMRRVGRTFAGGAFTDYFSFGLPEGAEADPKAPNFDQVAYAIRLNLTERAGKLPRREWWKPFHDYAEAFWDVFADGHLTMEAWRSFFVQQYSEVPPGYKARAIRYRRLAIFDRFSRPLGWWWKLIGIIVAILTAIGLARNLLP